MRDTGIKVYIRNGLNKTRIGIYERDIIRRAAKAAFAAAMRARGAPVRFGYAEVVVTVTDDAKIREINREHRGIDAATDVLSFPLIDFSAGQVVPSFSDVDPQTGRVPLGDILISTERAKRQADEYGHGYERELGFLTAHGTLHLLGYDHVDANKGVDSDDDSGVESDSESAAGDGEMRALTEQALASIGLSRKEIAHGL
jgi:probable rRNA maturation factor